MPHLHRNKLDEEDVHHKHCSHALLPRDATILIEIDLKGDDAPLVSPVTWPLEPQEQSTARIFLCATSKDASNVFKELGDEVAMKYIKSNTSSSKRNEYADSFQIDGQEILVQYDPRRLLEWIWIEPHETKTIIFPEIVSTLDGEPESLVQNQLRISRDAEDRFTVVWFDFRDLYNQRGFRAQAPLIRTADTHLPKEPKLQSSDLNPSRFCQRRFAYSIFHPPSALSAKSMSVPDFPAFVLLDIIENDLKRFESHVLRQNMNVPMRPLYKQQPFDPVQARFKTFPFLKAFISKAEGIQDLVKNLAAPDITASLSSPRKAEFTKKIRLLAVSSTFVLNEAQRADRDAEQLLSLHSQVIQTRQAASMSALTYCAAFFLPLSLSASLLSMDTRFSQLGLLLYDFFGVATAFLTFALVAFYGQRSVSKIALMSWVLLTRISNKRDFLRNVVQGMNYAIRAWLLMGWLIIVASFLVGIFAELRLGIALLIGGVVVESVIVLLLVSTALFLRYVRRRTERKRESYEKGRRGHV